MKLLVTVILVLIILGGTFLSVKIIRADTTDKIPRKVKAPEGFVSLCDWPELKVLNPDSLMELFPFSKYLDSCNYKNIQSVKKDLACMDALYSDSDMNRQTLSIALTEKLGARHSSLFTGFNPDSLLPLIQWAEKFETYADADPTNDIFYNSIYNYWMQEVSKSLSAYIDKKPGAKFDFNYRYLWTRCSEQHFSPRTKTTNAEKALLNIIYNKWGHFFNAAWNQTSLLQKILLALFFAFTFFGITQAILKIINYIKKKQHHE